MAAIQPPPPLRAPTIPPYQAPPVPGAPPRAPAVGPFTGAPPATQPYGAFTGTAPAPIQTAAFDPSSVTMDPGFGWRLSQGVKARERSAAARGTLLTGGLQKGLEDYGQNEASQEYGNAYQRALQTYGTNRDTNAQNFGQGMQGYQASLAAYGTNRDTAAQNFGQAQTGYQDALAGYKTNADTAAENFARDRASFADALSGYDRSAAQGRMSYEDRAADELRRTGVTNANNASTYQAQMLNYQLQQEEARRAQEDNIRRQEQERIDAERRRQEQLQQEAIQRAASERQNAASAPLPMAPYLPYGRQPRRTGASAV